MVPFRKKDPHVSNMRISVELYQVTGAGLKTAKSL